MSKASRRSRGPSRISQTARSAHRRVNWAVDRMPGPALLPLAIRSLKIARRRESLPRRPRTYWLSLLAARRCIERVLSVYPASRRT